MDIAHILYAIIHFLEKMGRVVAVLIRPRNLKSLLIPKINKIFFFFFFFYFEKFNYNNKLLIFFYLNKIFFFFFFFYFEKSNYNNKLLISLYLITSYLSLLRERKKGNFISLVFKYNQRLRKQYNQQFRCLKKVKKLSHKIFLTYYRK